MSVQTLNYQPTYWYPIADAGTDVTFDYPTIGNIAQEVYEINPAGVRTLVPLDNYFIEYTAAPERGSVFLGGTVVFTAPLLDDTWVVSIERNTPITQLTDFKKVGEFPMNTIEFVMDKITLIMQEIGFRKCSLEGGPYVTAGITQLVNFYPYGPFRAATIDFVLDKVTTIAADMMANKTSCSNDLDNT
jgi:hypothetical protein